MAKRIALAGKPKAGKTTLAKIMWEKYGYRRADISGFIVDEYVKMLNAPWLVESRGYELTVQEIYDFKDFYRPGLQVMGDDLGLQDPEKVIGVMRQVLTLCGAWDRPNEPVVLEPIRGEIQASAARALGFVVVELWVDDETQKRRVGSEEAYIAMHEAIALRPDLERGVESASARFTPALSLDIMAKTLEILEEEAMSHGPVDQPFEPFSFADWGCQG